MKTINYEKIIVDNSSNNNQNRPNASLTKLNIKNNCYSSSTSNQKIHTLSIEEFEKIVGYEDEGDELDFNQLKEDVDCIIAASVKSVKHRLNSKKKLGILSYFEFEFALNEQLHPILTSINPYSSLANWKHSQDILSKGIKDILIYRSIFFADSSLTITLDKYFENNNSSLCDLRFNDW